MNKITDIFGKRVFNDEVMKARLSKTTYNKLHQTIKNGETLKSDIAEEVARFYGYNNIPDTLMRGETTRGGYNDAQLFERSLGTSCRALGYDEIITYSFISPSYYDKIRLPEDSPLRKSLRILNPLGEDTSIMRTTILPSMMEVIARNNNYRNSAVRLYELGKIYIPRDSGRHTLFA